MKARPAAFVLVGLVLMLALAILLAPLAAEGQLTFSGSCQAICS